VDSWRQATSAASDSFEHLAGEVARPRHGRSRQRWGVKRQSKDWLFSFPEKSIDTTIGRGACSVTLVARADFAVNEGVRGEQGDHQRLHAAIVICICLVGFL